MSRDEAVRLGQDFIGTEHLLLGLMCEMDSLAMKVLDSLDVDTLELQQLIEDSVPRRASAPSTIHVGNLPLNKQAEKVLKVTFLEAKSLKSAEIAPEHLLLSILKHKDNPASRILSQFDVDYEIYKAELEYVRQELDFGNTGDAYSQAPSDEDSFEDEDTPRFQQQRKGQQKSRTPVLDNFGRDVTRLAEEGKLDP
ncbi:MAG: Clp protease N-terminal domain-containing protein, partial [Saprospiraceae bacterium]